MPGEARHWNCSASPDKSLSLSNEEAGQGHLPQRGWKALEERKGWESYQAHPEGQENRDGQVAGGDMAALKRFPAS